MREVKFRGYRLGYPKNDRFGWVYGGYFKHLPYTPSPMGLPPAEDKYEHLIISEQFSDWNMKRSMGATQVDSKSVGQFTGLKNQAGREIYEGDVIQSMPMAPGDTDVAIGVVTFLEGSWVIENDQQQTVESLFSETKDRMVLGNIYQNAELLEEK